MDVVQLEVETARVADRLAHGVATPQGGGRGAAVAADQAHPSRRRLQTSHTQLLESFKKGKKHNGKTKLKIIFIKSYFGSLTILVVFLQYNQYN